MIYVYYVGPANQVVITDVEDPEGIQLGTFQTMPKARPEFIAHSLLKKNFLGEISGISVIVAPHLQ